MQELQMAAQWLHAQSTHVASEAIQHTLLSIYHLLRRAGCPMYLCGMFPTERLQCLYLPVNRSSNATHIPDIDALSLPPAVFALIEQAVLNQMAQSKVDTLQIESDDQETLLLFLSSARDKVLAGYGVKLLPD